MKIRRLLMTVSVAATFLMLTMFGLYVGSSTYESVLTRSPPQYEAGALITRKILNMTTADNRSSSPRVLVWVMTMSKTLHTKAAAVNATWGQRCEKLIFFSSDTDRSFPAVGLNITEGRSHLTAKTMAAFRYIYEHHFDDADWFMKADDDTYVVMENLKRFLASKDSNDPVFFGHHFKVLLKQGYYSGGGGYVISKEALRRFGKVAVNSTICEQDGKDEDVDWGACMEKLGVKTDHGLDEDGKTLFHPSRPTEHFSNNVPEWLFKYSSHPHGGLSNVSPWAITFHYVTPEEMRMLHYFLYYWRVEGSPHISGL